MNRTVLFACTTALLIAVVVGILTRYQLVAAQPGGANGSLGVVYSLDRWTGRIVALHGFDAEVIEIKEWEIVRKLPAPKH